MRSSLVLRWGRFFGRDLMRNEFGVSQMVGVERRKEPAVTGLLVQSPERAGERGSQKELHIWSLLMQLQPPL